ncbi:MAG: hypothetical protein CMJ44_13320 [Pimelobacter sp.]|nr:hypothetical protein [Pimelobacter sp.]
MPDATIIGRVGIKVVPDTEDFKADTKVSLEAIERSIDPIQIDFEAQIEDAVADVRKAIDKAQKAAQDVTIELNVGSASTRAAQARLAYLSRTRVVDLLPQVNEAASAKALASLAALSGARGVFDISTDFANFLGNLDKAAPRIGKASLAIANLSSLALSSVSNMLAFGSSVSSIAGSALALPGIFGGTALGLGATVAVLKDFNQQIPGVGQRFHDLQDVMSENFYDQAAKPFESFIDTIFPQFAAGMADTSVALGSFFADFAQASEGSLNGQLGSMFDDLADSIVIAGEHTDSLLGIIEKLGEVGAGNLPALADYVGGLFDQFDSFLGEKGPDGLQAYIDSGVGALQDLGGAIKAAGSLFAGLSRAAEDAGGSTLAILRETLEGAASAVNGPTFQAALSDVFRASHEGFSAIVDASREEAEGFALRLSSVLSDVLPSAGRAAGNLLSGLFNALDTDRVQEALTGLFDSIERATEDLGPSLDGLAEHLAGVVDIASILIETIAGALTPIIENLGPIFDEVVTALLPLIETLGDITVVASTFASGAIATLPAGLSAVALALGVAYLAANKAKVAMTGLSTSAKTLNERLASTSVGTFAQNISTVASTMLTAGARTQRESARMRTALKGIGVTAGKAAVGVGAVALASSDLGEKLGVQNTLTYGLIGSAFGPYGAAVGAAAGALKDFSAKSDAAKDAQVQFAKAIAGMDGASVAAYATSLSDLTAATDAYFDSLGDGSFGTQIAKSLTPSGLITNLDFIFGSGSEKAAQMTAAAADAAAGLDDLQLAGRDLAVQFGIVPDSIAKSAITVGQMDAAFQAAAPALQAFGYSVEDIIAAVRDGSILDLYDQLATYTAEMDSQAGRTSRLTEAIGLLDQQAISASVSAEALKASLDALLDPQIGAEAALDAYKVALQELGDQFDETGLGFRGFGEDAIANKAATRDYIATVKELLVAQAENGASAGKIAALVAQAREEFIKEGTAADGSTAAIEARANAIGLTPKLVRTVFKQIGVDLSRKQLKELQGQLDRLPETVRTVISNKGVPQSLAEAKRLGERLDLTTRERKILLSLVGDAEVNEKLKGTRKAAENIADVTYSAQLDAKDDANPVIDKTQLALERYAAKVATATIKVNDQATAGINRVSQALTALNNRKATVYTEHRTTYTTRGGRPSTSLNDPLGRVNPDALSQLQKAYAKNFERVLDRMQSQADNAFGKLLNKFEDRTQKAKLRDMFVDDLQSLKGLTKFYDRLNGQYDKAVSKLAAYRRELKAFREQVSSTVIATGDVTQLGALTYDGIVRGLADAAERAEEFQAVISGLIKADLNETTLQQLLQAGPEAGLAVAQAILSGGVDQVNELQEQLADAAGGVANAAGTEIYGDLIVDAEKDVQKLLKKLVPLQKKIQRFVKDLMKALREQLKADALKLSLGDIVTVNIPGNNGGGKGPGVKGSRMQTLAPSGAVARASTAPATGTTINKTLIYNAAPGSSLGTEEDLFAAVGKARGGWL